MANNYKHLEIVSKKGIAGKKSTLVSPANDNRKIVTNKKCSPNTRIPNTQNSLLIK
jgi:hypothetical protein